MPDDPPGQLSTVDNRTRLRAQINGQIWTQVLRFAVRLRLADHLADDALTLSELAARTGANRDVLRRLLNGLLVLHTITLDEDDRYRLTPLGEGLREDAVGSLASYALLSGEEYARSWMGFDPAADDDVTPFARVSGAPFFDWLGQHPEVGQRFNQRMAQRISAFAAAAAATADLSTARTIIDIGGGHGVLLEAFLRRWANARGVLFDLPGAAAGGQARLVGTDLVDRVEIAAGDFFTGVTAGGDVYILSQILHDWDDARCQTILRNIRRAIAPTGRLLIIEVPLPERVEGPHPAVELDLIMLVLTGGKERTIEEYRALLEEAGFSLIRVYPEIAAGGVAVLEAEPV
jgi:SAM-dependent methyltransferase